MNKATLISKLESWSAPSLVFKLEPPLNDNEYIIIAAANGIERYEMIIFTCNVTGKHKLKFENIKIANIENYKSIKNNLPAFKKTLESIGYKMYGEVERHPKSKT